MASSRNNSTDFVVGAIASCLDGHVGRHDSLAVALSGGADSVVMLHCLQRLAAGKRFDLSAIHVHHGLSPNADAWETHCRVLCADWKIPLAVHRVQVERRSSDGLEAAARRARHAVFAATPQDWVALGHHRNDQAETLMFNLLRGTGLRGAAAMGERRGRLLRPMLTIERCAIIAYATGHGLTWIEDESNSDTRFSRNYLRHAALRELEDRFPGSTANLAAAAARFGEAGELLDDLARLDLQGAEPSFPLNVSVLKALTEPRARNLLRYLLQRQQIGIPSEERLREALRQLLHAAPDRHPAVTFGRWRLLRRRGRVLVDALPNQDP